MGIHSLSRNKKKTMKQVKRNKLHRLKKAERKRQAGPQPLMVDNVELLSKSQLRNKLKSRRCAINVSGKRRSRMIKRLCHQERNSLAKLSEDAGEMEVAPVKTKVKKSSTKTQSTDASQPSTSSHISEDVDMDE